MVGLGLGVRSRRLGLSFAALTALPADRQPAVTTAANAAAATLGVSAQSIVDSLAIGRGLASLLPNDGCLLASSGGAPTVQGDPVGAFRSWTGQELAEQANASRRPVSGSAGLVSDGTKYMQGTVGYAASLNTLSLTFLATGVVAGTNRIVLGYRGSETELVQMNESIGIQVRDSANTLRTLPPTISSDKIVYFEKNGVSISARVNDGAVSSETLSTGTVRSTIVSFFGLYGVTFLAAGTIRAFHWSDTLITTAQRAAVREFCLNYYGVTF